MSQFALRTAGLTKRYVAGGSRVALCRSSVAALSYVEGGVPGSLVGEE